VAHASVQKTHYKGKMATLFADGRGLIFSRKQGWIKRLLFFRKMMREFKR